MSNIDTQVNNLRQPPWSLQAEQSVLGGLMLDNGKIDQVSGLTPDDFYRADHQSIFAAILGLAADSQPFDVVTLSNHLKSSDPGLYGSQDGLAYLGNLAKDTPSAANMAAYVKIVAEKSQRRALIAFASSMMDRAYDESSAEPGALIDEAEQGLFRIGEQSRSSSAEVVSIKQGVKSTLSLMDKVSKLSHGDILGSPTGFADLDELTDGFQCGDLVIVAGRPSMGKTAFAGDLEYAVAKSGSPVLTFSMEMPVQQLTMRHISRASGVPLKRVRRSYELTEYDWPKIANSVKPLSDLPLYICDQSALTVMDIRATARRVARQAEKDHGQRLGLIVIDYLQLMTASVGSEFHNKATQVADMSRALKVLAGELGVPIVVLSQLNRSLEQRPNKRPVMSDLRDSGAIEQDADIILFVYRDEVYNPDSETKGMAEIICAKQRNGAPGTVNLTFDGACTRFRDYSPEVVGFEYAEGFES